MRILHSPILVPGIGVRVELNQRYRTVLAVDGAQNRQQNRMIATDTQGNRSGLQNRLQSSFNFLKGVFDRQRIDRQVSVICYPQRIEGADIEHRMIWSNNR